MALYPSLPADDTTFAESSNQLHSLLPACSVCLDEFCEKRPPKYLSCHHTLCEECVHQLLKFGKVECPLCRKITLVSSANVLQTNNDILTMARYGHMFVNLWCHDCKDIPKPTCQSHRVSSRTASSEATIGQKVDGAVEAWTPTVTRVVETTQGWAVVAVDATCATVSTIAEYMTPLASYISDWFSQIVGSNDP